MVKQTYFYMGDYWDLMFDKPNVCPCCRTTIDAECIIETVHNNIFILFFSCPKQECKHGFIGIYAQKEIVDNCITTCELLIFPPIPPAGISKRIEDISPFFMKLYKQAFDAEYNNSHELAKSGYGNAIEVLIKDYAIKYKNVEPESLQKKSFVDCLKEYINDLDSEIINYWESECSSNMLHYPPDENKQDNDFTTFKTFLDILISHIDNKVSIAQAVHALPKL